MCQFTCPTCGSSLVHERNHDGTELNEIQKDGTVVPVDSQSNASNTLFCKSNPNHPIPGEQAESLIDLILESQDGLSGSLTNHLIKTNEQRSKHAAAMCLFDLESELNADSLRTLSPTEIFDGVHSSSSLSFTANGVNHTLKPYWSSLSERDAVDALEDIYTAIDGR